MEINKSIISIVGSFILLMGMSCDSKDDSTQIEFEEVTTINSPYVFVMDWRFSRSSCGTGPGVCFMDDDGNIWDYVFIQSEDTQTVEKINDHFTKFNHASAEEEGTVALQLKENSLRMIFSKSLEESTLIIPEDVVLNPKITAALGKSKITLHKGSYALDHSKFEHGAAVVPVSSEAIQLDYHADYGFIGKDEYQVNKGSDLEDFLEELQLKPSDLEEQQLVQGKFTGIALAEHLVEGKTIQVWHRYTDEPVAIFEGRMINGKNRTMSRILRCGNQFGSFNSFDFFWAFIDYGCLWCN